VVVPIAIVTVLLVGVITFAIVWSGRGAEEASVDEAVESLDDDGAHSTRFLQPATGVYVYEGDGTESLSVLDTTQQWGPQLPATVERDRRGCWTFTIEYNTHHRQATTYCARGDVLEEIGGSTFQSFDFVVTTVDDHNVFECEPPGETIRVTAEPGTRWRQSCRGRSRQRGTTVTAAGTNFYVGTETVRVGREVVDAYHYRAERTLSGDQSGTDRFETWYRVLDGLPVRYERDTSVESSSPIGAVTYTEHGRYTLSSLTPRR
jgi:hypothetical protein